MEGLFSILDNVELALNILCVNPEQARSRELLGVDLAFLLQVQVQLGYTHLVSHIYTTTQHMLSFSHTHGTPYAKFLTYTRHTIC